MGIGNYDGPRGNNCCNSVSHGNSVHYHEKEKNCMERIRNVIHWHIVHALFALNLFESVQLSLGVFENVKGIKSDVQHKRGNEFNN